MPERRRKKLRTNRRQWFQSPIERSGFLLKRARPSGRARRLPHRPFVNFVRSGNWRRLYTCTPSKMSWQSPATTMMAPKAVTNFLIGFDVIFALSSAPNLSQWIGIVKLRRSDMDCTFSNVWYSGVSCWVSRKVHQLKKKGTTMQLNEMVMPPNFIAKSPCWINLALKMSRLSTVKKPYPRANRYRQTPTRTSSP